MARAHVGALARRLSASHPCIPISPQSVNVLDTPSTFHNTLLNMIQRAKSRVLLSSLYLGGGAHELISSLRHGLESKPELQVQIHLDYLRSTRPNDRESVKQLASLVHDFPERAHVALFRSPKLKGFMAKAVPPRFDEGWGTWHAKIYGVDDEILLSGANLSKSYFTNRQDRYLHFANSPGLAKYCSTYLDTFRPFSYSLQPSTEPAGFATTWKNWSVHPYHTEVQLRDAVLKLRRSFAADASPLQEGGSFIVPSVQAGYADIREEEECMQALFEHVDETDSAIDLTSGYFGLYKAYQEHILRSSANCRVVAASPLANGFYGSAGVSGHIPAGYTLLEQRFWRRLQQAGRTWDGSRGVRFFEWERPEWTYHAKGMWLRSSEEDHPYASLFGSTNLSSRSAHLDTELSFVLLTGDGGLQQRLNDEVAKIQGAAVPVDEKTWETPDRKVDLVTKLLVYFVEGML